jgi:hypothetical protein
VRVRGRRRVRPRLRVHRHRRAHGLAVPQAEAADEVDERGLPSGAFCLLLSHWSPYDRVGVMNAVP